MPRIIHKICVRTYVRLIKSWPQVQVQLMNVSEVVACHGDGLLCWYQLMKVMGLDAMVFEWDSETVGVDVLYMNSRKYARPFG